eukprot:3510740-Lingulodinium_polyedra.AAC.1
MPCSSSGARQSPGRLLCSTVVLVALGSRRSAAKRARGAHAVRFGRSEAVCAATPASTAWRDASGGRVR